MTRQPSSDQRVHRGGRPRRGERVEREQLVLDAAFAELIERGYDSTTMLSIATRAGASKETLYSWFDNRDGLFVALIERSGDASAARVVEALGEERNARDTLVAYAEGLLQLLTSPGSIALNRAAMSDVALASRLLASGRHRIGPIVEEYLEVLHGRGDISAPDASAAFEVLYGLIVRDIQIRVLLGEDPPSAERVSAGAVTAVEQFLALYGTDR